MVPPWGVRWDVTVGHDGLMSGSEPLESFEHRVSTLVGSDVVHTSRLAGGDVADARRVVLDDGRVVVAKTHASPPPDFFETEAAGLTWLREPDEVRVPEVLGVEPGLLVIEWIESGRPSVRTDADFGRSLARLHRVGAHAFGREDRRTTGSRALPNEPFATWPDAYAANRLTPLARLATDTQALSPLLISRVEALTGRLWQMGAADEGPARLHGDLWAGNRLVDAAGQNWLIDPAAHGGHREFDLAMMRLFGGFGEDAFEAYNDEWRLTDGWRSRIAVHQLAPLMVHAIKFGGGYANAVERAVAEAERI